MLVFPLTSCEIRIMKNVNSSPKINNTNIHISFQTIEHKHMTLQNPGPGLGRALTFGGFCFFMILVSAYRAFCIFKNKILRHNLLPRKYCLIIIL
jgi:hypothetical protein